MTVRIVIEADEATAERLCRVIGEAMRTQRLAATTTRARVLAVVREAGPLGLQARAVQALLGDATPKGTVKSALNWGVQAGRLSKRVRGYYVSTEPPRLNNDAEVGAITLGWRNA